MLRITGSCDKLASSKNKSSRLVFEKNNNNNKIDRFDINSNKLEYAKKLKKSKSEKLFKSQNLAKSKKSYQKIRIHLILVLKKLNQAF